jgi:hypothetical protein
MTYGCPVCMFGGMPYPPKDYNICPCCGTEFGNDDAEHSYEELRDKWIASGAPWFFGPPPANWDLWVQIIRSDVLHVQATYTADTQDTVLIPA